MPGFDKTGPDGEGPLTGRGLGPCGKGNKRQNARDERIEQERQIRRGQFRHRRGFKKIT